MVETIYRRDDGELSQEWRYFFHRHTDLASVVVWKTETEVFGIDLYFLDSSTPMGIQEFRSESKLRRSIEDLVFGEAP